MGIVFSNIFCSGQDALTGSLPPDHFQPHPLLHECILMAQKLVDSVGIEDVISALVFLDALARRPGRPREAVCCNRRMMARLVDLCCIAPRKDILTTSLSVNFQPLFCICSCCFLRCSYLQ
jgi:hypothetical protein